MQKLNQLLQSVLALIIAFIIVNLLCFCYERPVAWIDRESGVTDGVRRPNGTIIHGTEGFGITKLDVNGYVNLDKNLADEYVLVMGSSHTQGKEVSQNERYTEILNTYLARNDDDNLYVYNVASDANYLPSLLKRFTAGIEEFPNAEAIVIEIGSTDYSIELLEDAREQVHYNEQEVAEKLYGNVSFTTRIKHIVKEYVPLISLYKNQLKTIQKINKNVETPKLNTEEYKKVINEDLQLIRSMYSGNIIFVYHPNVKLESDGTMTCVRSKTANIFMEACENNKIMCIDTGNRFVEHYNQYSEVPYGFHNTTMGNGHLNAVGHKILADEIYKVLREVK